jgi:hypothetical protein
VLSDRQRDRRVRKLMARRGVGRPPSLGEVMYLCPFRSLLADSVLRPGLSADDLSAVTAAVVLLGFVPDDFSAEMRADILGELGAGGVVLLVSNSEALRDHAKGEILLALVPPRGVA